jgi:hypothetical protein
MQPTQSKKKQRVTGPPNMRSNAPVYAFEDAGAAMEALKRCEVDAVIIDAKLDLPFDGKKMVKYWNARVYVQLGGPTNLPNLDLEQNRWLEVTVRNILHFDTIYSDISLGVVGQRVEE